MAEPTNNSSAHREQMEAALDDAVQQQANLERAIRHQFAQGWQSRGELDALPLEAALYGPGMVTFTPEENNSTAKGPVTLTYDIDASADNESVSLNILDGPNLTPITSLEAAERLGVEIEVMAQAANGASSFVRDDITLHRALYELGTERIPQLEHDLEVFDREEPAELHTEAAPEWATNSQDQAITPERVAADWVQSTTMVRTYLESGRSDLAREWIEMLDENLTDFAEGGTPPGSDELEDVYHDAVARAAIPYGEAPITPDEVRRQLGNISREVPELDVDSIRQSTGVMALDGGLVTRALEQEAELPTGMAEVAEARLSVRRAMASITEDSENAQEYLWNANRTLTHALEGMRPDQGRETVAAAQESVQQASERVAAVAETAAKVDAEVTVYTTDGCPGCFATKRALDKAGVEYDEISLKEHPDLVAKFKRQLGKEGQNVTAPIVETKDGDIWSGYNPSKLKEHGLDHRTRQRRGETNRDTGHGR